MGTATKPLSKTEQNKVRQYPCDGVKRYRSRGDRGLPHEADDLLTYEEARKAIMKDENCEVDLKAHSTNFTRPAIRRLGFLNEAYLAVAKPFVVATYRKAAEEMARLKAEQDKARAEAAAKPQPTEEVKADERTPDA